MSNVKIKSLLPIGGGKVITIDGLKILDKDHCIVVTGKTGIQMCDDVNWKLIEGKFTKEDKPDYKPTEQELLDDIVKDDVESEESDAEVIMGDDDTKELIKKIPTMSLTELQDVALEVGIETENYPTKKKLQMKIIRVLKGKE